jgi:uncharacterized protein (DUF3820 family)
MDNNQVTALSVIDSIDTNIVARTMDKIHAFQQVIQQAVKPGHDIGIIPGTDKPTLLKPGAEKIVMMMGLSSRYEIMDKVEDYDKGFFSYNVKCVLSRNDYDICEGVGNCNSRESKYVKTDPYSIANTILKMAKKRAYVDAALSVASLSDIFTQDLEDMPDMKISSGPSHRDNQGKPLLEQVLTFGKHKGRTFADLLGNERDYLEWLANSDNQKWGPIAKQVLEEAAKTSDGETADLGGIPASVTKMAYKAGMTSQDLINFINGTYNKPWTELSGPEKNSIIEQLQGLSQ